MYIRDLVKRRKIFVVVVMTLNNICLTGCEMSKKYENAEIFENLTNEELDKLEQEIKELPKDSIVLRVLDGYLNHIDV